MYEVTNNAFIIPDGKEFIIYAPLSGRIIKANQDLLYFLANVNDATQTKGMQYLLENLVVSGLLIERLSKTEEKLFLKNAADTKTNIKKEEYLPTSVTLFPTNKCNLRCKYCFASAGDHHESKMHATVAKKSIDLVYANAIKKELKSVHIAFHGGGEPFSNFKLVKDAVNHAKSQERLTGIKAHITTATNGVLGPKITKWIISNIDHTAISLDGPRIIQDYQRPQAGGGSTYEAVINTLRTLESASKDFSVRCTVTDHNIAHLTELVSIIHHNTSLKKIHIEPVFEYGRCASTGIKEPSDDEFVAAYKKARTFAEKYGITIHYSGISIGKPRTAFCGAALGNFFVTPQGYVTSCIEVPEHDQIGAETFVFGYYDSKSNEFLFNLNKLSNLNRRTVDNLAECNNCFAKYDCAGDCLLKTEVINNNIFNAGHTVRCNINRAILLYEIKRFATKLEVNDEVNN